MNKSAFRTMYFFWLIARREERTPAKTANRTSKAEEGSGGKTRTNAIESSQPDKPVWDSEAMLKMSSAGV